MQILSSDNTLPVYTSEPEHTSPIQAASSFVQAHSSPRQADSPSRVDGRETEPNHEDASQEDTLPLPESQIQPQEEQPAIAHSLYATPAQKQRHAGDDDSLLMSQHLPSSVGYLSNRWNYPTHSHCLSTPISFNRTDDSFNNFLPSSCSSSTSALRPRLSTGLDGKAEVVTSPPQNPASLPAEPQSFDSACGPNYHRGPSESPVTLPPIFTITSSLPSSQSAAPLLPRLTRGRSRDVHAWEFACDAENREDALTVQAKHESRGSAIAAINLLRSTSSSTGGGSPLQPSRSNKRNASISGMTPRADSSVKKPRLTKGLSATGRLETPNNNNNTWAEKRQSLAVDTPGTDFSYTKPKSSLFISPQGNESDKENWSPDENGTPRFSYYPPSSAMRPTNRRLLPSGLLSSSNEFEKTSTNSRRTPPRRGLMESSPSFLLSGNRANTAPLYGCGGGKGQYRGGKGAPELRIYEDFVATPNHHDSPTASRRPSPPPFEDDGLDEVERFMRGEVSPSKKGDADAVAGLLSLSQGNWR